MTGSLYDVAGARALGASTPFGAVEPFGSIKLGDAAGRIHGTQEGPYRADSARWWGSSDGAAGGWRRVAADAGRALSANRRDTPATGLAAGSGAIA